MQYVGCGIEPNFPSWLPGWDSINLMVHLNHLHGYSTIDLVTMTIVHNYYLLLLMDDYKFSI